MSLLMVNVPAESCTTCPSGHPSNAAWIPDVASCAPSPYVVASTVAQTVERAGVCGRGVHAGRIRAAAPRLRDRPGHGRGLAGGEPGDGRDECGGRQRQHGDVAGRDAHGDPGAATREGLLTSGAEESRGE